MKWFARIAVLLVALIAVATVALLVLGRREGANRLEASIEIAKPAEALWPFLFEEAKLKQWVTWLVEARPSAEPVIGQRAVWTMRDENNGGQLMKIESVVIAAEPARRLEVEISAAEGFSGHGAYTLTRLPGGGTRVETRQTYAFDHWFARLMTPVVLTAAASKVEGDLLRLKAAAEKLP